MRKPVFILILLALIFSSCNNRQLYYSKEKYNQWIYENYRYDYIELKIETKKDKTDAQNKRKHRCATGSIRRI